MTADQPPAAVSAPAGSSRRPRVLLVLDVRLYREGLERVLAGQNGLELVASVATVEEGLPHLAESNVDVVLAGSALSDLRTLTALASACGGAGVVGLGTEENEETVIALTEAGVESFLGVDASVDELLGALQAAQRGETACSPRVAGILRQRVALAASPSRHTGTLDGALTAREREIVSLLEDGLSNRQIAQRLCIQPSTVKNHMHNIFEKLHVRHRWEVPARLRLVSGEAPALHLDRTRPLV